MTYKDHDCPDCRKKELELEINNKIFRLEEDRGTLIEIYEIIDPPKMIHTKLLPEHIRHMKDTLVSDTKELLMLYRRLDKIYDLFKYKPNGWVEDMYKELRIKNGT